MENSNGGVFGEGRFFLNDFEGLEKRTEDLNKGTPESNLTIDGIFYVEGGRKAKKDPVGRSIPDFFVPH